MGMGICGLVRVGLGLRLGLRVCWPLWFLRMGLLWNWIMSFCHARKRQLWLLKWRKFFMLSYFVWFFFREHDRLKWGSFVVSEILVLQLILLVWKMLDNLNYECNCYINHYLKTKQKLKVINFSCTYSSSRLGTIKNEFASNLVKLLFPKSLFGRKQNKQINNPHLTIR